MSQSVSNALFPRATFEPVDRASVNCARPQTYIQGDPLWNGANVTFHQFMIYFSAGCLGVTVISSLILSWRHLHRYTAPQEQRQILRIINMPAFYCLFNFLALCWYENLLYIEPLGALYEAFAVAALFYLILEFVCPEGEDRERFFSRMEEKDSKGRPVNGGSLKWFQSTWKTVMSYPLTKLAVTIIQIVTQYYNKYCMNSFAPRNAHLWLFIADILLIGGALGSAITFYVRLKKADRLDPAARTSWKVYSFTGVVIFQYIQGIIFGILNGRIFTSSPRTTYNDINFGIPAFMTCVEAVIFSLIFHYAYSSTEYKPDNRLESGRHNTSTVPTRKSPLFAIGSALNITDILYDASIALAASITGARVDVNNRKLLFKTNKNRASTGGESSEHVRLHERTSSNGENNNGGFGEPPAYSAQAENGPPPEPEGDQTKMQKFGTTSKRVGKTAGRYLLKIIW